MQTNEIQVISLLRSVLKRSTFVEQNKNIPHLFVNAVDGLGLTKLQLSNEELFEPGLPYTAGAFGCALSHLLLWKQAIATNKHITIAEDDAIFRNDFIDTQKKILASIPTNWDIVLWGWNFDSILSFNVMPGVSPAVTVFNQEQLRASIPSFKEIHTEPAAFKLDKLFGIPAYTISPKGAKKFKALCFPLKNFTLNAPLINGNIPNYGIDIAMCNIYQSTDSYVCFPPLVVTKNDHSISSIQEKSAI